MTATDTSLPESPDPTQRQIEESMIEEGQRPFDKVADDYFGFDQTERITLPDNVSWVEHKIFTEGQRRKYLDRVNRDVRLVKGSGDAIMKMAPGAERKALLEEALVDWNLKRAGEPIPFSKRNLEMFLDSAPPKIVDLIEKEVRKANSWLQSDVSVEDLDREIEALQELREKKIEEEEGKDSSASK